MRQNKKKKRVKILRASRKENYKYEGKQRRYSNKKKEGGNRR